MGNVGYKNYISNNQGLNIPKLASDITNYIRSIYKDKKTFLYDEKIDNSMSYYNVMKYDVTNITKAIIKDRNYFEYHRIEITIELTDNDVKMIWKFQGKYGAGLLRSPKITSQDYKDIESNPSYYNSFKDYEVKLFEDVKQLLIRK